MRCRSIRRMGSGFIIFCVFGLFSDPLMAAVTRIVPTFHAMGIYYSSSDGGESNTCSVEYKIAEADTWQAGLDLWYDARNDEYRGSVVDLVPGITYQVKTTCDNPPHEEIVTATTWKERFPVGSTVYLPAGTTLDTLQITESGSPDAYVLYTHPAGSETVIDVANARDHSLEISAAYVIIRGLTLKNAAVHGVKLLPGAHDVVIENCDISGWGRLDTDEAGNPHPLGFGINEDAGIYSNAADVERIIIQRNKIHHPRHDTNSWKEFLPKYGSYHPRGPKAIVLKASGGNHVIRYNEIYSDDDHYFNDCIGESGNFGIGFPHADTDIYANYLERSWDDAIESEGYNRNVRIWGNYIDRAYIGIAAVPVHQGPLYIWKNVMYSSRKGPLPEHNQGAPLIKLGGKSYDGVYYGDGKLYLFHNTSLMPPSASGLAGHSTQLNSDTRDLENCVSRNNILQSSSDSFYAINNKTMNPENDFDYDLYNGLIYWGADVFEQNGLRDKPLYVNAWGLDRSTGTGIFALKDWSPGYDAGQVIPNFNDDYIGQAPDMGAHEAGSAPMEFGVQASYLNARGLAGYWPFDESPGSATALDKSGLGNRGSLNGETARVEGKSGRALVFDGNGDYVEIADAGKELPDFIGDLSISLWIKPAAATPDDEYFIAKTGSFLWKLSNNIPYFTINTTEAHVVAAPALAADQWQHLSAVYDVANQEVRIYLDGELRAAQAVSGAIANTDASLYLGHPSSACLNGLLDEVRIYDRMLTGEEVRAQAGIITESVLAGQWLLDEGDGDTTADVSGNDNHGVLYGDTAWVAGKTGNALKFDGDADYLSIPDTSGSLALDKDFSISMWLFVDRNTGGDEWFLGKGSAFLWKLSNRTPYFFAWNTDHALTLVAAPQLTLQQWHHLAATYDSSAQTITIFVDGQPGAPVGINGDLKVNTADLSLGSTGSAINGKIDEVMVFNSALSPQAVDDLFIPADLAGDLNDDGVVDRVDVRFIISHRNQSAEACVACDLDEDGIITVADARKAVLLCTCQRCLCP